METRHREDHYKSETSDTVIVFVHGVHGSPTRFEHMIGALDRTYSVANLLLPGHGKTIREFAKSSMSAWQGYVDESIGRLRAEYEKIILVGHSMGCLLSVQSAVSNPQKICGLFLVAIPLSVHMTLRSVKNNLAAAFGKSDRNEIVAAARSGCSVSASSPFGYLPAIPRYIELLKKCRATRALLSEVQIPAVVVHSAKDELVSNKTLRYVETREDTRVIVLNNSGHYYYAREDKSLLSNALIEFIPKAAQHSPQTGLI